MRVLKEGIPITKLQRTFADAILATRSIGLKYLWIDTLCIIQGSDDDAKDDWRTEAMHMGDIYENSLCTIAATHAANSTVGCFIERDPRLLKHCKHYPPVALRLGNHSQVYILDEELWESVSMGPVNSRAWVIQERLLSPRIVHFCAQQLFWECAELGACESFPAGLPAQFMEQPPSGAKIPVNEFKALLTLSLSPEESSPSEAYRHWTRIVAKYSQCGLTYVTDKLIALTGTPYQGPGSEEFELDSTAGRHGRGLR
ncbi:heterokaryon incompatibility protein [Hirsutella rhossiliensis]|uniref:Heterokaryon incompatibility protein (HET) domain-containing protein n=1 Tax=Hirsutella rhossiliensis TaxID=111463 RepID=A0A9P8N0P0_9HYPO|nr:heterokaryon incompatibility protein (HET) domain-containing protein [Hirsutella rhossiliensis]KAH0965993.1 heterokaryon incompatibility protein (HET) domain-containing protein [Hirsutella rhossiliensis]